MYCVVISPRLKPLILEGKLFKIQNFKGEVEHSFAIGNFLTPGSKQFDGFRISMKLPRLTSHLLLSLYKQ